MMSDDSSAATATTVQCGACQSVNTRDAKFCEGCGHPLYEPCGECNSLVLLSQRFCGGCGCDLSAGIERRREKYTVYLKDAVAAAKESRFHDSLDLLSRVSDERDFRFKEQSEAAAKAFAQVTKLKERRESEVAQQLAAAKLANEEQRYEDLVNHLSKVPKNMMDETNQELLRKAKDFLAQVRELSSELVAACNAKDWCVAGMTISQLTSLLPGNPQYQQREEQIAQRLLSQAKAAISQQQYERAGSLLDAIPEKRIDSQVQNLTDQLRRIQWIQECLQQEPFLTQVVAKLAAKLVKLTPDDAALQKRASQLIARFKGGAGDPKCDFPANGQTQRTGWLDAPVSYLTRSAEIETQGDSSNHQKYPGQFNVAFGLAIQGLGGARITGDFHQRKKKLFGRKKKTGGCWGIDIGSKALKAVRMEASGDSFQATHFFHQPLEQGSNLRRSQAELVASIKKTIDKLKEEHDLENDLIWANLPATDTTFRFVRLPPVKGKKKVDSLIEAEIRERLPIDIEELCLVQEVAPYQAETVHGRAASFFLIRKQTAESRGSLLAAAGLEIDGLQAEPVALANFAAHEFEDLLTVDKETLASAAEDPDSKLPSVVMVDVGATSTTLLFVSSESTWFWSVDSGGTALDHVIARTAKVTHQQAEKIKMAPHEFDDAHMVFDATETILLECRSRMQRIARDAKTQNGRFDVRQVWLMGGGSLSIGYARHTMCEEGSS